MMKYIAALAVGLWLSIGGAIAQTSPNLTYGQVLTPAQWNQLFINKNDTLGFAPLNSAGGIMTGRLVTAPPGTTTSGLNLGPGSTPAAPVNGDLWVTSSGLFVQVNGATVGPLAQTGGTNVFTGQQTTQGLTTTSPGWYTQITGDANARVRIGLNSTDVPSIAFGIGSSVRDTFIERAGVANIRHGSPDAAAPVAQTLSVQNVVAGTSNTAGASLTVDGSQGTGTGAGGDIIFKVAPAGSTGSAQNALVTALHIFGADGGAATGSATDQGSGTLNLAGLLYANGTAPTGTGAYVRATSPVLVTPALGTPTSGILSTGMTLGGVTVALGSDATGDLYCRNSSGVLSRIGIGASTTLLTSGGVGTCPTWVAAPGGGNVSNVGTPTANQFALWTGATTIQGVNAAAKSDQQAGTSAILPVTPSQQQNHPSAVKVEVNFLAGSGNCGGTSTCTLSHSYNISNVTRTGTGTYTVNFVASTFTSTLSYECSWGAGGVVTLQFSSQAQNSIALTYLATTSLILADPTFGHLICTGS